MKKDCSQECSHHHSDHICWGAGESHPCTHQLDVHNISVSYGKVSALSDMSFSINCGHTMAIMGPNGAGKSTLIKVIAGLVKPDDGSVLWNKEPMMPAKGEIAYLPQRSEVDWTFPLTVQALVEMGRYPALGPWKRFSKHDRQIVEKSLETMNLTELKDRQIGELSGGQQQRVFLARALAQEAHLLLLDEPFTGLDSPSSQALGDLLRQLAQEGRLVIASHHDLNTASKIFDHVLLIDRRKIAFGASEAVLTPDQISHTFNR